MLQIELPVYMCDYFNPSKNNSIATNNITTLSKQHTTLESLNDKLRTIAPFFNELKNLFLST